MSNYTHFPPPNRSVNGSVLCMRDRRDDRDGIVYLEVCDFPNCPTSSKYDLRELFNSMAREAEENKIYRASVDARLDAIERDQNELRRSSMDLKQRLSKLERDNQAIKRGLRSVEYTVATIKKDTSKVMRDQRK